VERQHQFLICLGFGIINLLVCIAYRVITVLIGVDHQSKQWTLGKWVFNTLGLIVIIGLVNYLFVAYLGGMQFQWIFVLSMLGSTLIIGMFPLLFIGAINVNRKTAIYNSISTALMPVPSSMVDQMTIYTASGDMQLQMSTTTFLYAESSQNYIDIILRAENTINKETLRNKISLVEDQLRSSKIVRCHRSYIVNLDHVVDVKGNAQGLKLYFDDLSDYVPVSRKYIPIIQQAMT
jgi:hypothetical protein